VPNEGEAYVKVTLFLSFLFVTFSCRRGWVRLPCIKIIITVVWRRLCLRQDKRKAPAFPVNTPIHLTT
jgi:hypothetical protein